jgi:putative intracellular protease/amidase
LLFQFTYENNKQTKYEIKLKVAKKKYKFRLSEKLKSFGAKIVNKKADETTCIDRRLITGASPLASNNLGKLAVKTLLKELK